MKINKYGLKITGLKKTAGELRANLPKNNDWYSGKYMQVNYNTDTGELWSDFFYSLGANNWKEYHNTAIIRVCNTCKPLTMQELADAVALELRDLQQRARFNGDCTKAFYGKATKKFLGVPCFD